MKREEEEFQIAVIDMLKTLALPGVVYWHVPNGGKRSIKTAARLKRMGVKAGVSDLHVVIPGRGFGVIELKAGKGSLRKEQRQFLADIAAAGSFAGTARTMDEVLFILNHWGAICAAKVAA